MRVGFINGSMDTCVKIQEAENKETKETWSPSKISQYCTCYSNNLADKLSNNEAIKAGEEAMKAGPEKAFNLIGPKADAAREACLKEVGGCGSACVLKD